MTTLTWFGGGDNLASNPMHWLPYQAPQPGEMLSVLPGATVNIVGGAVSGDTFMLGSSIYNSSPYTLNVSGSASSFNIMDGPSPGYMDTVVNLAANLQWVGGMSISYTGKGAQVMGAGTWNNTASMVDNVVTVGANVGGTGNFHVMANHALPHLEFMHAVGSGQTVTVDGDVAYGQEFGTLQVDTPAQFHASVTLGYGEVILEGLHVTRWQYQRDMLTLYSGGRVVDTLRLTLEGPSQNGPANFGVSQTAAGVVVHTDGLSRPGSGHAWT